jgi:glycosyltransferase involved in cell wall biosynthesis
VKICLIAPPLLDVPPKTYGGLERVVWDLACGLSRLGHEVDLVATVGSREPPGGRLIPTVKAPERADVDWLAYEVEAFNRYKDEVAGGGYDIVHDNTWFFLPYNIPDIRIVHTHHSWLNGLKKPVERPCLVGISKFHAMSMANHLFGTVWRWCYNPVNPENYPFQRDKGDYLLFVGRIDRIKAPHYCVEIARRAGTKLVVAGGTFVLDKEYVRLVKHLCEKNGFTFLPDIPEEKKVELMQNAAAVLFTPCYPFQEPFGLVAVEAALCGTPVIAFYNGATPEVVYQGVSGYLVSDVDDAVAVIRAGGLAEIKPEECRAWGENFSPENIAAVYLKLYRQAIENPW